MKNESPKSRVQSSAVECSRRRSSAVGCSRRQSNAVEASSVGLRNGNFGGLPTSPDDAHVVLIPVPWDATVSSGDGTRDGPRAILDASPQLEFLAPHTGLPWTSLAMLPIPASGIFAKSALVRRKAQNVIDWLESDAPRSRAAAMERLRRDVNVACERVAQHVEAECTRWLAKGKAVGVVGGDHSTALGLYRALGKMSRKPFGILHIDAHCDLREAYEGFTHSHASIMRNALEQVPRITTLTQVAVRDFCAEERAYVAASRGRIACFDDRTLAHRRIAGEPWAKTVRGIVSTLPRNVVVSLDIDGLEPWQCPNTGTPVPGGLRYEECFYLIEQIRASGRRILAFDVTEVAPGRIGKAGQETGAPGIDAAVGARAVYRLATIIG